MTTVARRAYGQARARARSAAILTSRQFTAMAAASTAPPLSGWCDLGLRDDGSVTLAVAYARLVADHRVMRHAYPDARQALEALLQLHELENVKLLWRAAVRNAPFEVWRAAWRPLGDLQTIASDRFKTAFSPMTLATALAQGPYGEVAEAVLGAHGDDLAAAELAFDRFGTQAVAAACDRLSAVERSARTLLRAVVAARDALIYERARTTLGLEAAAALTTTSSKRQPATQFAPPGSRSPVVAVARRVLALEPFSLAVPLALVLTREEEIRRLVTLSELRARHASGREARQAMGVVPA